MNNFFHTWHEAARISVGLFWTAFWAFGLGYLISSMIAVFVTRERMRETMGETGPRSVVLGTFFGFISSSCSFAALASTRALFAKGARLIPSLAFLLASTNLVIELGIVIAIFLGWQFVVGEYVGGILLIVLMWLVVKVTRPDELVQKAREKAREEQSEEAEQENQNWKELIKSREGWRKVARQYIMEWQMVWKDVAVGFTIAGIIAAFVPRSFFQTLFVGSGSGDLVFWQALLHSLIGPVAAFFTFIGSMGNIPLAAVLFANGVSFAGIMAFIFSDLVVLPVLRIQSKYYGWKMALYIMGVFLVVLVAAALILHYGFAALGLLPDSGSAQSVAERTYFEVDYTLFFNLLFLAVSALFGWLAFQKIEFSVGDYERLIEKVLFWLSLLAFGWLAGGWLVTLFIQ
ncbi:MAG: permease [Candidatus Promineifilaceae bacterium]|nr:permease [Candidatus Promineifilaceae bacterium]